MTETYYGVMHNGQIELFGEPQISEGSRVLVSVLDLDEGDGGELGDLPEGFREWAHELTGRHQNERAEK